MSQVKNKQQNKKKDQGANIADCDDDLILTSSCTNRCGETTHGSSLVVDSIASFHATYDKSLFTTYKKGSFGIASMGNHHWFKVIRIGNVNAVTNMSYKLTFKNVRHVQI